MMKLPDIDIPDDPRMLRIFKGRELIAHQPVDADYILVKVTSCSRCGLCCMDHPPVPFPLTDKGWCSKLTEQGGLYECMAGSYVPFNCCSQDPNHIFDKCSITHKRVRLNHG